MVYRIRKFIKIFSLLFLATYVVTTPISGEVESKKLPEVKAYYTQEIKQPVLVGKNDLNLTAKGVFVLDADTGIVLFDKNPHQRLKPASLTKIMTSLIAMDWYDDNTVVKVINGQRSLGNTVKLVKNDELVVHDLLYALLVSSGNDAAVTLAENYPGGYSQFVQKMNEKVAELGLKNTHFSNVSGVEGIEHFTSAYDIATIARSAINRKLFKDIVVTKNITINSLKGNKYPLTSTNILLGRPDILGVKTGWTPEAGECLVLLANRDGHNILISILGSEDRFGEGKTIIDWVFQNYSWQ